MRIRQRRRRPIEPTQGQECLVECSADGTDELEGRNWR